MDNDRLLIYTEFEYEIQESLLDYIRKYFPKFEINEKLKRLIKDSNL